MIFPSCSSRVEKRSRNDGPHVLFHCGDNGARYAFVLGGGTTWGESLGEELRGDFLSRYGKGGYEEKSPIYGELQTLVWGGSCRLVHWGIRQ